MHWGDYGWGLGWVSMVVFWVLAILGAVYLLKAIAGVAGKGKREETALDILKKRYAKGEITREDFEKMKSDLMKS